MVVGGEDEMNTVTRAQTDARRVRLSLDVSVELHTALKVAAAKRRLSMSELLRQLLENSLAVLGNGSGSVALTFSGVDGATSYQAQVDR